MIISNVSRIDKIMELSSDVPLEDWNLRVRIQKDKSENTELPKIWNSDGILCLFHSNLLIVFKSFASQLHDLSDGMF